MSCMQIFQRCLGAKESSVIRLVILQTISERRLGSVSRSISFPDRTASSNMFLMKMSAVSLNFAVFSIHDELIGPVGILENMAVCQRLGYTILIDDTGGHRLDKSSLRKIRDEIFKTDF